MTTKVVVNGYGVVGKRVADAVNCQEDMDVHGIIDIAPTSLVGIANERGYPLFAVSDEARKKMIDVGMDVKGVFEDALQDADIVIDTAPKGITTKNVQIYEKMGIPYIVNGGEKHALTGSSFSALANYRETVGVKKTRVVSCNTTTLCRIFTALKAVSTIDDAFISIVRRGADPVRTSSGPINAIIPVLGGYSHHAPDVNTVIPDLKISSLAVKTSSTLTHVHMIRVKYNNEVSRDSLINSFKATPRIILVSGQKGITDNAQVIELFRDKLRPRNDMFETAIWEDSIFIEGDTAVLIACCHMESVAVPENVDAIRAVLSMEKEPQNSVIKTDKGLGIFQEEADYSIL
jgi:glyceraldehyde-3-phosphate dehydrogenase (NAD(P))